MHSLVDENMHSLVDGLQKVVRWFLYPDDNPDSYRNIIISFWPIYNVP